MSANVPVKVFKYLLERIPPYTGLLLINTDNEGGIIECIGNVKAYTGSNIERGDIVTEIFTPLTGIIPLEKETLHLKKIHISSEVIADIHIVKENGNYWIILVDQTSEVERLRSLIQNMNEWELKKNRKNEINYFEYYYIIDFVVFRKTENESFLLLQKIPQWIKKHQFYNAKKKNINPLEAFPFLEVFILEAKSFWDKKENGYLVSDMWSEEVGDNLFHLRAFAVNYKKKNYLLVKTFNKEGQEEQKLVQAYRDSSLAFDKLAKTEKKLKQLLEYKNKFNSIISHDLRSPIASVMSVMDVILSDTEQLDKLSDMYKELLHDVKDEMIRLLDYNDKLYHWANLELGNFKLEFRDIPLKDILKSAYKTHLKACEKKNITLGIKSEENILIRVDEVLFLQALNNLLSNAVKFTPSGKNIFLSGYEKDDKVLVEIQDEGIGISKETIERFFKKNAIPSTLGTSGEKGTGLGIDIVKKIVNAHGFKLSVGSKKRKGTKFTIEIPQKNVFKGL